MKLMLCWLLTLLIGSNLAENPKNAKTCECVLYDQCKNNNNSDNYSRDKSKCADVSKVCCPTNNMKRIKREEPTKPKSCGKSYAGIMTGSDNKQAEFGEFPWMVAILHEIRVGRKAYQCGGALIHPQIVLTAAHCVDDKEASSLTVRVGDWDTQTKNEMWPDQNLDVQKIVVHENYKTGDFQNDFGMLILSQPVDFKNEHVGIVCLPKVNENFDRSRCFASGWGKDQTGYYQTILKRLELPVVPRDQCQNTLRTSRFGQDFQLDTSFICAGGESEGTCKGDDGSPLVCPMKNDPMTFVQAGIVAWASGCGKNQDPGVFANVAASRIWIDQQATKAGFNLNEYQSNQ